jgi:hypothetical protein
MNDTIGGEVARYATAVRAAFADLPGPDRELLLEDLEDHLQEVAAEAGPLEERLGRPEAYAAELRASAGLPAVVPGAGGEAGPWLRRTWGAQQLERLWAAVSTHPASRSTLDFLPELRPAWWVVRGYLAVQAVAVALAPLAGGNGLSFPVPRLFGSVVLGLLATAAAVAGSVRLGRAGPGEARWPALTGIGNAALALFAVFLVLELGSSEANDDHGPAYVVTSAGPVAGLRSGGREISNIFPFDADGKPLRDVSLIDQDGRPVVATHFDDEYLEREVPLDRHGNEVRNRYPQVQHQIDPATGARRPGPTPEFQPPPGPLRSP